MTVSRMGYVVKNCKIDQIAQQHEKHPGKGRMRFPGSAMLPHLFFTGNYVIDDRK